MNEPTPDFQYADWADLLGRSADSSDNIGAEWQSVSDLAAQTGAHVDDIRQRLNHYKREGRLEMRRVTREAIDGTMRQIPVYRVRAQ